jgi:hypothetical protein
MNGVKSIVEQLVGTVPTTMCLGVAVVCAGVTMSGPNVEHLMCVAVLCLT